MHGFLTLAVFAATLALMLTRPRGLSEAWAAAIGASLMFGLRLVTWRAAVQTTTQGADVLLFLFALMLLSGPLDQSGFFDWAAILAARAARGRTAALFASVFVLGFLTTALLSLDTTAIILTPIVLAFVARLKLEARPYLLACAFVANSGSLLLPVSNLTNLLFMSELHLRFERFALVMALPQLAALGATYLVLRRLYPRNAAADFAPDALPAPASALPDRAFFGAALAVLAVVLIGYFVASLSGAPAYLVALGGCAALLAAGLVRRRIDWRKLAADISWPLFVFVVGLFVVVRGVENLGLAPLASRAMAESRGPLTQIAVASFGAGIGSNVINNIPMAMLAIPVVRVAGAPAVYGALIGCDIGPNLTIFGSLATMLVIAGARKRGISVSGAEFFRAGLIVVPIALFAAALALWVTLRFLR